MKLVLDNFDHRSIFATFLKSSIVIYDTSTETTILQESVVSNLRFVR